ncbi:hypothetical protein F9L16_12190 [Agarivorans sp. B2Z047]|uniref:hypothetical protein n=1 Tax=Agarivorans sp. B2Z047 TaxID=2652721 RepID=UPI00128DF240|nr:hypothetical protein [Agarivorans sp. B2Z047]MPW29748.1 hypothetical protein [Agarivorans sp. B2Z047]UQN43314.1 hypothetical protein LQZ07_02250 [Agarivorans sp. B2Z047]
MYPRLFTSLLATTVLFACGGGGDDSTPSNTQLSGLAIDGYISGATAFLDINFNGRLDAGEPSALTNENGQYDLALTGSDADCADYAPIIIDVPVGAIDSDYGEVEEAYQLSYPPAFAILSEDDLKATTPLTSIVWNSVEAELVEMGEATTCAELKANYSLQEDITKRLEEQEWRVARRYNITVEELYSDYIAEANAELHAFAQELVPGLQKSYEDTADLYQSYPDAFYVYVEYYLGKWFDDENEAQAWYREEFVAYDNSNVRMVNAMSPDLEDLGQMMSYSSMEMHSNEQIEYEIVHDVSRQRDNMLLCNTHEFYEQNRPTRYAVVNQYQDTQAEQLDCFTGGFEQALVNQTAHTKVFDSNGDLATYSYHVYNNYETLGLSSLIGLYGNIDQLDGSELDVLNFISTDFENTDNYEADSWIRHKNSFNQGEQVATQHDSDGLWIETTLHENGTYSISCGPQQAMQVVESVELCY